MTFDDIKREHFEILCELERERLHGGGVTTKSLIELARIFHNEGCEKGMEYGKREALDSQLVRDLYQVLENFKNVRSPLWHLTSTVEGSLEWQTERALAAYDLAKAGGAG